MICLLSLAVAPATQAQTIYEYTVKRTPQALTIDGELGEPAWQDAPLTEAFVQYRYGTYAKQATQAKMLWDDTYLYVAFIMNDKDVWAATEVWSSGCLCDEEVAEVFIDPDGDGIDYLEMEINPYGALMPLRMTKAYSAGGSGDYSWTCPGLKIGTKVNGTLNNASDTDQNWVVELAIPFSAVSDWAPTMDFPPRDGDSWRLNLYRYEYGRDVNGNTPSSLMELTAWNQTDSRGFHAPDKFGRIIFSTEISGGATLVSEASAIPHALSITSNYPNPFNPVTTIGFTVPSQGTVRLDLFNVTGQKVRTLLNSSLQAGTYTANWDGRLENGTVAPSGIYFARITQGTQFFTRRMMLLK